MSLPKTRAGSDRITPWVDRVLLRLNFPPFRGTDTAVEVDKYFFANIFRNHVVPDSIVCDRYPNAKSKFWTNFLKMHEVKRNISSTHHLQTDGASEVINGLQENYLRCHCSLRQAVWDEYLRYALCDYNSSPRVELRASEVEIFWIPKYPLEHGRQSESPVESANEFKNRLEVSLEAAIFAHELAKSRNATYTAKKYTRPSG